MLKGACTVTDTYVHTIRECAVVCCSYTPYVADHLNAAASAKANRLHNPQVRLLFSSNTTSVSSSSTSGASTTAVRYFAYAIERFSRLDICMCQCGERECVD
jgi:hypothetical protein